MTRPTTSFRTQLLDEHVELAKLCDDVLAAFERGDRDECDAAFRELEERLEQHLAFEEREIFPSLRRFDRDEADALDDDHRRLRGRLTEVGIGVDLHAARAHNVRALLADLGAHAQREGALMYRWADETFDPPAPHTWLTRLRAL